MKRLIEFNKDVEKINWEYKEHQDVMHVWVHIKFDDGERMVLHSIFQSIERFYSEEDLNLVAELMVAKYNLYDSCLVLLSKKGIWQ